MTQAVTRRAFLVRAVDRRRQPARTLFRLLAVIAVAWIAVVVFQVVRGMTISGWTLIGFVSLAATVLYVMRWGAARLYARLDYKGKAVCRAAGEVLGMLAMTAVGILAWHKFQSGSTLFGIAIAVVVLLEFIKKGYAQFRRDIGAQE